MKKNDLFSSLKDMMFLVQLEEFFDNFNADMKSRIKNDTKKLIKALIPLVIGGIVSIVTLNPIFFCLGLFGFSISAIVKMTQDVLEEEKRILANDERMLNELKRAQEKKDDSKKEKVIYMDQEPSLDSKIWGVAPIIKHKDSDFYTDQIKEVMEDEKLAVDVTIPKLEIVFDIKPLNKLETQDKIVKEYEMYCIAYKLPVMNITANEWDTLFDVIYNRLDELNITDHFYECMNFILQYTLASSLLHKGDITIYSFVRVINKLEILGFSKKDIESIIQELDTKLSGNSKKVVDFKTLKYPDGK